MTRQTDNWTASHLTSFGEALFPGTRKKILRLFFGQPERSYTISELIDLADAGSGAVQREVERLTASGLLKADSVGRQKRYRANPDSPIYAELHSLVTKAFGPAERLRETLWSAGDSVDLAILYGSVAKGTDRADSDIDVLLVSDSLSLEDAFRLLSPVETELGRKVNPTLYTRSEFRKRFESGNPFLRRVLAGKHTVLKGDIDDTVQSG